MTRYPDRMPDMQRTFKPGGMMGRISGPPLTVESSEGKVIRTRPFHYDEKLDIAALNPWKLEGHGLTFGPPTKSLISPLCLPYRRRVDSVNRVRWPLKRVDWDPNGERNPQNRGTSKYVRISWDEAAQLIADELLRVKEKYGMSAVLSEADMHGEGKHLAPSHGCANRLLSLLGGYTIQMRNQDSWEGWGWGSKNVWGGEPVGEMQPSGNVFPDIVEHSQMLLFWGCDPETTPKGMDGMMPTLLCNYLSDIGLKSIYVDPACNFGAVIHADKWIPVLPNTDAALYLAIAWVWLTEGTYNKEYVESHAVGYQEFFDYVLGKTDGETKDPKWASPKCGIPAWTIKALAREWGDKITSICIGNGGPGIRGPYSTEPARLQSILLGMQGLGGPGVHQVKMIEWGIHTDHPPLPFHGKVLPALPHTAEACRPPHNSDIDQFETVHPDYPLLYEMARCAGAPPAQSIPKCMVHDAILKGSVEWWGLYSFCGPAEEQWIHYKYPADGCSKIHMIWTDSPCMVTCWNDGFNFTKAFRSSEIECIVAQHPWLENDCIMADIILPVCTTYEMDDIGEDFNSGVFTSIYREHPACPPVGESVNDFECVSRVAKKLSEKLGPEIYDKYTFDQVDKEELIEMFFRATNADKADADDTFHRDDIFVIPCDPDVKNVPPGWRKFYEDPALMPLSTPTGKLEFTSTKLKELFPDDEERPPHPKWIEKGPFHDERLSSERAKKYPLLCMSNHGHWRMHAQCDDITWNREIETMKLRAKDGYQYEPVWLNPITAVEHGIEHGDIVKVYNERGIVLCGAYVTERVMPRVAYVDHGARFDPIDLNSIDRGGAINLITPHAITSGKVTGMAVSGFLVDVRKVTDDEMRSWKAKYPEAFERTLDDAAGLCLAGWLVNYEEEITHG